MTETVTASQNVFFDLDGTLTDPKVGITNSIQYALGKLGAEIPRTEELLWCIGPPLLENFQTLLDD
jgi:phosphoglycolate phosphatase